MIVADLHVHTTNSDGTMTLGDVPEMAWAAGLRAVAITDHDRLHPDLTEPITRVAVDGAADTNAAIDADADSDSNVVITDGDADDGTDGSSEVLTGIHGIELRVDAGFERVDLLGYGVRPTAALERELERLQADRIERGRAIVDCVEDRLGVDLDCKLRAGIGRPHIARAIDDSDADYDYQGAFAHLIASDGPCFVPRAVPSFERGVSLLEDACRVVGLAHPFRYRDPERALGLCEALDAVERYYPYGQSVDEARLDRTIDDHDLLATGGSDAHDTVLGRAGISPTDYEPFEDRLSRP